MGALTNARHEAFARGVARGLPATRVATSLGYHYNHAYDVQVRPDVTARIAELIESQLQPHDISAQRVLLELGRIAFGDVRKVFRADGQLIPIHELDDDAAATITGIEYETHTKRGAKELNLETGEMEPVVIEVRTAKIKRAGKDAALGMLAKHYKLIGDEGDGVNALANALADRLKSARKRTIDITPTEPEQLS